MAGKKKTAKKAAPAGKAPTKSEIFSHIASQTDLAKKDVAAVFDALAGLIKKNVSKRGPGVFTVPGLMKITVRTRPATPVVHRGRDGDVPAFFFRSFSRVPSP